MKNVIKASAIFFIISINIFSQQVWEPGIKIKQALDTLTQGYKHAAEEDKTGTIEQFGITELYGTILRSGDKAAFESKFNAFTSYVFVAGGDENCEIINITVKDSKGNIIEKDKKSNRYSFVLFNPKSTGKYTVELSSPSVYKEGFAVVSVLEKNISADDQEMMKTFESFTKGWLEYNQTRNYKSVLPEISFGSNSDYKSFIFWGNYVYDNKPFKWSNTAITAGKNYAFLTSGNTENTKDLNVSIKYGNDEEFETFNTDKDNQSVILFSPKKASSFDFEIGGIKSKYGKTFIINCLLEIEK